MLETWLAFKALPWKLIGYCALGMALVLMYAALRIEQAQNVKLKAQIEKCADARKADRATYEKAQADAKAKNLEDVRQREANQQRLNDETVSNLNARLERLRSELRQRASAPQGHPGQPGPPEAGSGSGAAEAPGVCLTPEEHVRAAENEERHDQLITLIERLIAAQ